MRYRDNIDYLFAMIMYLGTHIYWWARSAPAMASELQLSEDRLRAVFDGFPGIFRKSTTMNAEKGHYYSLQARYAQREGGDVAEPDGQTYIAPLESSKLEVIIHFILKMAEQEAKEDDQKLSRISSVRTTLVAVGAAILSAIAAILTAAMRH